MSTYQAAIYPTTSPNPTVANADRARKRIGVCFSGGGSRALTCAWGQMIGLTTLADGSGKALMDQVRYLSSVSGGTWASALYTFRASTLSDAEFLGPAYAPAQLFYGPAAGGGLDVRTMGANSLGRVPQNFANLETLDPFDSIIAEFLVDMMLKGIPLSQSAQWLWMYIVGKDVLAHFGLYGYENSLFHPKQTPWNYDGARYFSLSPGYAARKIFDRPSPPPQGAFTYARTGAGGAPAGPMLIMNTNVVGKSDPALKMSGPLQIPMQVSPVAAGIYGANPIAADDVGGGSVESFAFSSTLAGAGSMPGSVAAGFPRAYSLADIASCSSAFYAALLAEPLTAVSGALREADSAALARRFGPLLDKGIALAVSDLQAKLEAPKSRAEQLKDLVPKYNYWPVGAVASGPAANRITQFTDGGDLENSGVAGLLAQVQGDVDTVVAFVNGAEVLEVKNGSIAAGIQVAPLFGLAYDSGQNQFQPYQAKGLNPFTGQNDPTGFLQIFANTHGEFDALRQGLYASNGGGARSGPAFCAQKLTTIPNTLLGIRGGDALTLLWVQNAVVGDWQGAIADPTLRQKLAEGQQKGGMAEFANFPYYSTGLKIHQTAAETNALAQMWAWCTCNPASPLSATLKQIFDAG